MNWWRHCLTHCYRQCTSAVTAISPSLSSSDDQSRQLNITTIIVFLIHCDSSMAVWNSFYILFGWTTRKASKSVMHGQCDAFPGLGQYWMNAVMGTFNYCLGSWYCLVTLTHKCKQLAYRCYSTASQPAVKLRPLDQKSDALTVICQVALGHFQMTVWFTRFFVYNGDR